MSKYFEQGKKITYAGVKKQILAMKRKPTQDRLKMDVMYFLSSVILRG